jgi:uncharacterized protein YraI
MKRPNTARAVVVAAALTGLAWPAAQAFAQVSAYTSGPVYLYAGPSGDYPVVSSLGAGAPVTVMGCVSDYSWCDVALPDMRGWVYAAYLSYPYQGQYVPLQGYGPVIGLPVIGFSVGTYWDRFYRNRPWYGERDRWAHAPSPRYDARPAEPAPRARPPEAGRSFAPPANAGRPGQFEGGRPGPQQDFHGGGAPRPEAGQRMPGQPGGNFGQPHPQAPQQPGGLRPGGGPAGGVEHGAPQMRGPGPGPMQAPGRPAAPPQGGGHPSGGEGGGHRDSRQPGQ